MYYAVSRGPAKPFQFTKRLTIENVLAHKVLFSENFYPSRLLSIGRVAVSGLPAWLDHGNCWYEFATRSDLIFLLGKAFKIAPQMRLRSKSEMCPELKQFFETIIQYLPIRGRRRTFIYEDVAIALDRLGAMSADGHKISASHVSNAIRMSIQKIGPAYRKPNYAGKNHFSFNSKSAEWKIGFAN